MNHPGSGILNIPKFFCHINNGIREQDSPQRRSPLKKGRAPVSSTKRTWHSLLPFYHKPNNRPTIIVGPAVQETVVLIDCCHQNLIKSIIVTSSPLDTIRKFSKIKKHLSPTKGFQPCTTPSKTEHQSTCFWCVIRAEAAFVILKDYQGLKIRIQI